MKKKKSIKKLNPELKKRGREWDLDELTYVLLHSPIRDVYLCIQGFDSRLACRICNNTVQSRIRADGPSAHWERRRRGGKNVKGRKGETDREKRHREGKTS